MILRQTVIDTGHPIASKIELIEHEDTIGNLSYELLRQDVDVSFDSTLADYIPAYDKEDRPKKRKSYTSRDKAKRTLDDWENKDWENLSTDIGEQNGSRNDGK